MSRFLVRTDVAGRSSFTLPFVVTLAMRLLTGFLPPDGGSADMLGHSVLEQSLEVRRRLGYLPENNPLPDDIEAL